MKTRLIPFIIVLGFFVGLGNYNAKAENREIYEIHSMFVYNFLKYIEWPNESASGKFIIAVVGDDNVYQKLADLYNSRTIGNQTVEVLNLSSVKQIKDAQLVYLSKDNNNEFDLLKGKMEGKSTLLVTDSNHLGKKGSSINFKVIGGKLKFEINESVVRGSNLKVSNQLMSLGVII